jgi:ribose-phosphate pyrophosphokinase
MDLHAPQIQGFFNVPVDHLEANSIFVPYLEELNLPKLTIAAPDMGGTPRAREPTICVFRPIVNGHSGPT